MQEVVSAEGELIYLEMLAVSNVQRELSGVKGNTCELTLHQEFSSAQPDSSESKLHCIMSVITSHENQFFNALSTTRPAQYIMSQENITEEIRNDLLGFFDKTAVIYASFCNNRFVTKSDTLSTTIHRTHMKTFNAIHCTKKSVSTIKHDAAKEPLPNTPWI